MVEFKSRVYYEDNNDNVVGAEITIYSSEGEVIDSIQITSKTDFDDLVSRLDDLDVSYIQKQNLKNEISKLNINASTLAGKSSTDFALIDHVHTVNDVVNFQTGLNWKLVYTAPASVLDSSNLDKSKTNNVSFWKCGNLVLFYYYLTTNKFTQGVLGTNRNIIYNLPDYLKANNFNITNVSIPSGNPCLLVVGDGLYLRPYQAQSYLVTGTSFYVAKNSDLPTTN